MELAASSSVLWEHWSLSSSMSRLVSWLPVKAGAVSLPSCTGNTASNWPHFTALHSPVSSKSIGTIFPTAFAHFVFLYHILVILPIFQISSLLRLLRWSMINDLWYYYNLLKAQMMVSIFSKYFQIKECTFFFRYNAIAHSVWTI